MSESEDNLASPYPRHRSDGQGGIAEPSILELDELIVIERKMNRGTLATLFVEIIAVISLSICESFRAANSSISTTSELLIALAVYLLTILAAVSVGGLYAALTHKNRKTSQLIWGILQALFLVALAPIYAALFFVLYRRFRHVYGVRLGPFGARKSDIAEARKRLTQVIDSGR